MKREEIMALFEQFEQAVCKVDRCLLSEVLFLKTFHLQRMLRRWSVAWLMRKRRCLKKRKRNNKTV